MYFYKETLRNYVTKKKKKKEDIKLFIFSLLIFPS